MEQQKSSPLLDQEENKVSDREIVSALATLTASVVCCVLGDEQVDEQIRLRDDVIFRQKQEMATQQQRIEELNEELKSQMTQAPIKEEGMYMYLTSTPGTVLSFAKRSVVQKAGNRACWCQGT